MKKRVKLFILGADYFRYLLLVFAAFLFGIIFPAIFSDFGNTQSSAFSPFGFYCGNSELVQLILHNFVTFCIYIQSAVCY